MYSYHKDLNKKTALRAVKALCETPRVVSYPSTRRSNPYIKLLYIQ
nr:MAG TPA: hypothetical protein [Caudoviricetes sp.]